MSIKSVFQHLFASKAAHAVTPFVISETQKAVAALKTTSIGAAVAADIKAVSDKTLTNAEKFEQVVANTAPLVVAFVDHPGAAGVAVHDVESLTRSLVQSIFDDTKSTTAGRIAEMVLHLLGIA